MFWTDWKEDEARIEQATLAGENRSRIVNISHDTNGGWPNGLCIDAQAKRLYWIDAKYVLKPRI